MGILNVTPDSFSDGGAYATPRGAADAALRMIAEGASAIDVGGESTRPGSQPVEPREQIARVVPVIEQIRRSDDRTILSVDTTSAEVAEAALDAGADAINDVSAGADDPRMLPLASARGAGLILMHRLVAPARDRFSHQHAVPPSYDHPQGVVGVVREHLADRLAAAIRAGVASDRIVIDPGLGFGKSVEQNLELIRATPELLALGAPVLSACSRKSFVGKLLVGPGDDPPPPSQRLNATLALSVLHLNLGTMIFRVHDVRPHAEALMAAWRAMRTHRG